MVSTKFVVQELTNNGWIDVVAEKTKEDAIATSINHTEQGAKKTRIIKIVSKIIWQSKSLK